MGRWTSKDIEKLQAQGRVSVSTASPVKGNTSTVKPKVKRSRPKAVTHIEGLLTLLRIPFETEYRFHQVRQFRFDIALVEYKIAVEYEGLMSEKSRHTTAKGYTTDATKYNLAQTEGWIVLRYTAMNYKQAITDIEKNIQLRKDAQQ